MRNIERYPGTKEAIKAWDAYHDGGGDMPFAAWSEQEYVAPSVPTLMDAAEAVADEWWTMDEEPNVRHGKIADLEDAIAREKAKPVRNVDRFATADEAFGAFSEICNAHKKCIGCPMEKIKASNASYAHCMMCWLYTEEEKEDAVE